MCTTAEATCTARSVFVGLVLLGLGVLNLSCNAPYRSAQRGRTDSAPYWPKPEARWREASRAALRTAMPQIADAEYINDDQLCMICHETFVKTFQHNVHRNQSCEKCHGPASRHLGSRGKDPTSILSFHRLRPLQISEVCLQCHEQDPCEPGARWRTSTHAHHGVTCTNCHTSHYNVPPGTPKTQLARRGPAGRAEARPVGLLQPEPEADEEQAAIRAASRHLGAVTPHVCYRCHAGKRQMEQVAHAHQICGAVGFDCKTCHDPHGKIRQETRTELCLQCHKGQPTMAWHSSTHNLHGVACTDCHNPHPDTNVPAVAEIRHTTVRRPQRLPMSVDEPYACYQCHPKIYSQNALPSHHPIKEGKMVCSDCHDAHGQAYDNLKEPTVNLVCYRCHAEKEGPFVWEHPPVTEDCGICHDPHGTVANNLLRQPATFLCLRCHPGHRGRDTTLEGDPTIRPAFYTDCAQCHAQVHGSNLPSLTRNRRQTR